MKIDHTRAIQKPAYRNRTARVLAKLAKHSEPRALLLHNVIHENDGVCCKVENWSVTAARLFAPALAEVAGRDPADVEAVLGEHEPTMIVVFGKRPD